MKSSFGSEPFRFVVDGKPIYVHKDIITRVSKPLDRLVNGDMCEANRGEAELKNVDGATFTRFCQWAYAGYYYAAEPSVRPGKEAVVKDIAKPMDKAAGIFILSRKVSKTMIDHFAGLSKPTDLPPPCKRIRMSHVSYLSDFSQPANQKERLRESFMKLRLLRSGDVRVKKEPLENSTPSEDFTAVFLSHARVYVFAEQYDIQPLKRFALNTLYTTLKTFQLWPENVGDLVALIRFVYENTLKPDNKVEPMRNMLMLFVGCQMGELIEVDGFRGLLGENTELVFDFCSMVAERIKEISSEDD